MAADLVGITEILQDALLRELGDEVDLIFRYGSHLQGTAHAYSDLDISYVPVHESTWYSITVMVANTLCDLYPMHWSTLERMADFDDLSSSVLLTHEIVYRRSDAPAVRMQALADRLRAQQSPEARPALLRKAQDIFCQTGYAYYLLRQAAAQGHTLACLQQGQQILRTLLHCLAVANQACIDTRKLAQVPALSRLPVGFAENIARLTRAFQPAEVLAACEALLSSTRELLLAERHAFAEGEITFAEAFGAGYPELKGDLQHVLLACERQDEFMLKGPLLSLYQELSLILAQVFTGSEYSAFSSLAEYEQDLEALGFPALLPYLEAGDFAGLHEQCLLFGRRLQSLLAEHNVERYMFATAEDLDSYLRNRAES